MPAPTRRPTDAADMEVTEPPSELLNQPWIDVHNHAQTLSWEDREKYALSGCEAMVMMAAGYHWTPYHPVHPEDVRYLWDDAINRRGAIQSSHGFNARLAIGIHTGTRVENPGALIDAMDDYCRLDEVVAIGETGVTPSQHGEGWSLDAQRSVLQGQFERAAAYDLPVILHTPSSGDSVPQLVEYPERGIPDFEKNLDLGTENVFDNGNPGVRALKENMAAARDAGLSEDRIIASHASPDTISYLMEETSCYASATLGHQWLLGVTAEDVAEWIRTFGPDRIMLDTDCANVLRTDPFAIKRAILKLYRLGIDSEAIRTVVYDNPRSVLDL